MIHATVYTRLSLLSSFFEWVMCEPALVGFLTSNPARLSRPKPPKAYQMESTKALTDEELRALLSTVCHAEVGGAATLYSGLR